MMRPQRDDTSRLLVESAPLGCYLVNMTNMLKKAVERASALPEDEQDAIASILLDEIEDEARWRVSFANSQQALARLAAQARAEVARGDVLPFDPGSKRE